MQAGRVTLRTQRVGDVGWVFHRQADLYAKEFGYSPVFEAYVARGLAPYLDHFDPARDCLWMAEMDGRPVGSVTIQHEKDRPGWAKLRWYYVEREARGHGAGRMLLEAAVRFAREAGYEGIALWTVDDLEAARRQYERAGFRLSFQDTKPCEWAPWGHEQCWELPLKGPAGRSQASTWAPRSS